MMKIVKEQKYSNLIIDIASLIEQGRKTVVRYVNTTLVITYWLVGRRIVEYEQKGKERAEYGEALLKKLSLDLTKRFGKGWGLTNLKTFRQFYLTYTDIIQKSHTVCDQLISNITNQKGHTVCVELEKETHKKSHTVCAELTQIYEKIPVNFETIAQKFSLSWSHYRFLMRLDDSFKREFYEAECISGNWSVRQLDRQIQSMLYERTALSKRKSSVIAKSHKKPIILKPEDEIKDPYVLEFLGLKDEYSESQNENC